MNLASVSTKNLIGDVEKNLADTTFWIRKLDKLDADFILFPELNLSGYTKNSELINAVLSKKDPVFQELEYISKQVKTAFAVGYPEFNEGKYYISHYLFFEGKLIGKHRKTHLGPTEKTIYSEGNEINVFEVGKLKIGMQLCFETHFPEISYAQAKQGANVLAMAFASPKETAATKLERFKRYLPARAYDNNCFVVACNPNGVNENNTDFPGLALIFDSKGNVVAEEVLEEKEYVLANIDLEQIQHARHSKMAWFNKYKREGLFKKYYIL